MIQKLRRKLIAVSMAALLLVLLAIMGTVNILNYRSILRDADEILQLLAVNGGTFPRKDGKLIAGLGSPRSSPELPYESRFFTVWMSREGEILGLDLDSIAAVDRQQAGQFAQEALTRGKEQGFLDSYRYLLQPGENGARVIFLDCTRSLETFHRFLFVSCIISLVGLVAVFGLIVLLSGGIVRPVSESYEKQKQFITDAGHEIKTPITIIDADAEVLEMELGEDEWLQDIRKQTKRLGSLVNDLIYLSKMEEEQLPLQTIDFPLSDVVSETAQSFQALARTQKKDFTIHVEPMLSLHGDEKAIRQLVSILLDNALKYTPEGGEIVMELKKQGKTVNLSVTNTAENLEKNDLDRLFDRFYRMDPSHNSQTGGYGIGLSIARAVVIAHKGKITAVSPDGKSLTISVILPC